MNQNQPNYEAFNSAYKEVKVMLNPAGIEVVLKNSNVLFGYIMVVGLFFVGLAVLAGIVVVTLNKTRLGIDSKSLGWLLLLLPLIFLWIKYLYWELKGEQKIVITPFHVESSYNYGLYRSRKKEIGYHQLLLTFKPGGKNPRYRVGKLHFYNERGFILRSKLILPQPAYDEMIRLLGAYTAGWEFPLKCKPSPPF